MIFTTVGHTLVSTTLVDVLVDFFETAAASTCLKENNAIANCCKSIFVSSASEPVTMEFAVVAGGAPSIVETKLISCKKN
jgi:hypothetical protein